MKTRLNKRILLPITVIALFLIGGLVVYAMQRDAATEQKSSTSSQTQTTENNPSGTRKETSEGSTFDVPNSVPKDAIKNYTLITENEEFKIRQEPGTNNYIVTLYAIINNPNQYSMYQDQLREYKQHALKYLSDNGIEPRSISITYEPQEAASL